MQEGLQKAQEEIKEKQAPGIFVAELDALTKAFRKDSRGRVRVVGPVSRTQFIYSGPARAKVQ